MIKYTAEIRVRYADTDQMQFVYSGKYPEYFEVARTEMMRNIGLPYQTLEKHGFMLPLLEVNVRYKNPAYYDDLLFVRAFVPEYPTLKIHVEYTIHRTEEKILVAEGFTEHVFMKKDNKKAVRPPEFFIRVVKPFYEELR
jgi:acyl-CoA thioester hydrolase